VSAIAIAAITFACAFGGALAGSYIRSMLPEAHLSKESQDVVRLGMGLVATMTALLLGLVTAAARGTYDSQDTAVKNAAASVLVLDRELARYGPEAAPIRDLLKKTIAMRIDETWPPDGSPAFRRDDGQGGAPGEEIENQILALSPQTEAQRWLRTRALTLTEDVLKTRWRLSSTSTGTTVPRPFLAVVIFWLTATFGSFGLFAPRNATVIGVLLVSALSVAAAVFLILELDGPFEGLIRISDVPWRYALAHLGL
jgi:hypothetical protein